MNLWTLLHTTLLSKIVNTNLEWHKLLGNRKSTQLVCRYVSFIHGELVMQFMFVMLVKQHGNHLGISCDCWVLQICQANSPLLSQKLALFTVFWIGLATVQVACIHIVNTSGSNALQCWLANVMWDVKFLSFSYINSEWSNRTVCWCLWAIKGFNVFLGIFAVLLHWYYPSNSWRVLG